MTKSEFDQIFDRDFVQPLRDLVHQIRELPESQVSVPLSLLEMRLRLALEAYDASEEE